MPAMVRRGSASDRRPVAAGREDRAVHASNPTATSPNIAIGPLVREVKVALDKRQLYRMPWSMNDNPIA